MTSAEKGVRAYNYQTSWEREYFVVALGDFCTCLICGYVFKQNKKYNVQRHYNRYHIEHDKNFPKKSRERKREIAALKKTNLTSFKLPAPLVVLTERGRVNRNSHSTTTAVPPVPPSEIALALAEIVKPFEDKAITEQLMKVAAQELLKDCEFKECLLADLDKAPLSKNGVAGKVIRTLADVADKSTEDQRKRKVLPKLEGSAEMINQGSRSTTVLSFKIAFVLAKAMKPFEDGAVIKQSITTAAEELLQDGEFKECFLAKINQVRLSRKTIVRRVNEIAVGIADELIQNAQKCKAFSLQVDETIDSCHITQLCVFIRMVFDDCTVSEEFLSIIPVEGDKTGKNMYEALKNHLKKNGIALKKIVSFTTNGSPEMTSHESGLIELCKNDPEFPPFTSFCCSIHRLQSLCTETLDCSHVMGPITNIIDLIRANPPQDQSFQSLLDEENSAEEEPSPCEEVRWPSGGRLLGKFYEALPDVKQFLESNNENCHQLQDYNWLQDFAFLTDLTRLVNELYLQIQDRNVPIWSFISTITCFREKITMWIEFFQSNRICAVFKKLKEMTQALVLTNGFFGGRFAQYLQQLHDEFGKRFQDLGAMQIVTEYFHVPHLPVESAKIASTIVQLFPDVDESLIRSEMIEIQHDNKHRFMITMGESGIEDFWRSVDQSKYENLVRVFRRLLTYFGSNYPCMKMISTLNHVKSKFRTRLTEKNLVGLLRVSVSQYEPDFEKLADSNWQRSKADLSSP